MSHVSIARFKHGNADLEDLHGRVQAVADAVGNLKGVVSSRTYMSHDSVILFTETEDFATLDRIAGDAETKAARVAMTNGGALESAGHEIWSGKHPSHLRG